MNHPRHLLSSAVQFNTTLIFGAGGSSAGSMDKKRPSANGVADFQVRNHAETAFMLCSPPNALG
jgi:hypothetical protein